MIADMLRAAAQIAPRAPLYSIDGKPVVTLWGHRSSGAAVASAAPALRAEPAAAAPASAVSSAVARGTAPASTPSSPAPAASQAGPIPSKATTAGATGMRSYHRVALFAASALVLLAALFWGWRQFTMRAYDKTASAGDIDAQITQAEARNRLLESEIARSENQGGAGGKVRSRSEEELNLWRPHKAIPQARSSRTTRSTAIGRSVHSAGLHTRATCNCVRCSSQSAERGSRITSRSPTTKQRRAS